MRGNTRQFNPNAGGQKIPDAVKVRTEQRLRAFADQHFAGTFTRLEIRFRGQFCYVDAYTEPQETPNWPPEDWGVPRDQYYDDLLNTPTHLCRLRFFGNEERWGFGFYAYSSETYKLAMFPNGDFLGPPEDAFRIAAGVYLGNG